MVYQLEEKGPNSEVFFLYAFSRDVPMHIEKGGILCVLRGTKKKSWKGIQYLILRIPIFEGINHRDTIPSDFQIQSFFKLCPDCPGKNTS